MSALDDLDVANASIWKEIVRRAYDAGVTVDQMREELGAAPIRQARWASGEEVPRQATRRLMKAALVALLARKGGG